MAHLMDFPTQLCRAVLYFVGSVIALFCIISLASYPVDKEQSIQRRNALHEAAGIVERLYAKDGKLPQEVTLDGRGELSEIRIYVAPSNIHQSPSAGDTAARPKPSEVKAFSLTYSWGNSDGSDTFDSITGKSTVDDYPSLLSRLMGSAFFLSLSYLCFRTAHSLYQGESVKQIAG